MKTKDILASIYQAHDRLLVQSVPRTDLSRGLDLIGPLIPRVYEAPTGTISTETTLNGHEYYEAGGYGCGFIVNTTLALFVDKAGYQQVNAALCEFAQRFIVLHEYGHALHQDLPEQVLKKPDEDIDVAKLMSEMTKREPYANGYAAYRLRRELLAAKRHDIVRTLDHNAKKFGFVLPGTPRYRKEFPHLKP